MGSVVHNLKCLCFPSGRRQANRVNILFIFFIPRNDGAKPKTVGEFYCAQRGFDHKNSKLDYKPW